MSSLNFAVLIGGGYGSASISKGRTALTIFVINSFIEVVAFAYIIYDTAYRQQLSISTALTLFSSEARVFVSIVSRLWIVKRHRYIQSLVKFERKAHSHRFCALAFALLWCWSVYEKVFRPKFSVWKRLLEINVSFVTVGRYHGAVYILCLSLRSLHEKLRHEIVSTASDDFLKVENVYKRCCGLLQEANGKMGNIHDCFSVTCFVYISTVDAMAVLAPCDLVLNVVSSVCVSLMPIAALVSLAERISLLMSTQRSRLRLLWVKEHPSVNIYAILKNQHAYGVRWLIQSKVMNFATALGMLSNIATYGSLILTTPLFQEASSFAFFCSSSTEI